MEAKDTVMRAEKVVSIIFGCKGTVKDARYEVNLAQAEISFKAGRDAEREFILQHTDRDERNRLLGIREVVEFLGLLKSDEWDAVACHIPVKDWQAKLKEWGIDGH